MNSGGDEDAKEMLMPFARALPSCARKHTIERKLPTRSGVEKTLGASSCHSGTVLLACCVDGSRVGS